MHGLIVRQKSQDWGTPGVLRTTGGFVCDTLELPWANNQRGISCIKAAEYVSYLWESPTFNRTVIRLEDRFGRKDCLIHNGNFAGDTGLDEDHDGAPDFTTQVRGCTLVGRGYGLIKRKDGNMQMGILNSRTTLAELVEHLQHEASLGPLIFSYKWGDFNPELEQPQPQSQS